MRTALGTVAILAFAALLTVVPSYAATASITIDSVSDRRIVGDTVRGSLSGQVLVQGTAIPSSAAPVEEQPDAIVADAGDSGFVASGGTVTLLGSGFGGAEPYSFAWTVSAGQLAGADSATAQVNTAGVEPGTHSATLTITDSAGATATDDVKFVVFTGQAQTLLDETRFDVTPGVVGIGAPGTIEFPFSVPANTTRIDVFVTWNLGTNDYDLLVLRPDGSQAASSGNFVFEGEHAAVTDPEAGEWTAAIDEFATTADDITVRVEAVVGPPDPRPSVSSGGPYRFAVGAAQDISGTVTGGTAPVSVGWDTDLNGTLDVSGTSFTGSFAEGRHLVTIKATDADGLERRDTTSVLVATPERLAAETTPVTVIAINDTGVNPYHVEFSAETYPDPDVLALTNNFQRHPSEYIAGYPKDAQAIRITFGKGYFPAEDANLWDPADVTPGGLEYGRLYWIPGTKVIGAIQPGTFSCSNCAESAHVILDDDGHGSGSSSVSVGNRYGYCGSCLLMIAKGLSGATNHTTGLPWVDINSNSWGTIANLPLDLGLQLIGLDPGQEEREAVERGQTVLFAAGNGTANAFESTSPTYGTSTAGPDWNVVVGAIRRDSQRAIIGDGTPAHLSAWGDGNLPSACRTGTVSQCAFGGTSAATPYTAGIFGTVLSEVRRHIGDTATGQRPGQVVAEGFPIAGSTYLSDGKLTRAELREAVLKTAFPLNQDNTQSIPIFPYPWTAPYTGDANVLFEGYGAATPNSAKRAIDVLLGRMPLPVRAAEDAWFAIDRQVRDSLWGGYDRDGDGNTDSAAPLGAFGLTEESVATPEALWTSIQQVAALSMPAVPETTTGTNAARYYMHREYSNEPDTTPGCSSNVSFMDQEDRSGDLEPCFESRITSVLAAFRPLGIWPSTADTTFAIPAGSTVHVELFITVESPTAIIPTGVLMAGDRELGKGMGTAQPVIGSGPLGAGCATLGELCWTKFVWAFDTERHAIAGEQLTFQTQLIGTRSWSFGYEGQHASRITIVAAPVPAELEFSVSIEQPTDGATVPDSGFTASGLATFPALGTTEAGDHPSRKRVDIAVDDPTFGTYTEATLDLNAAETGGTWSAPVGALSAGEHTIYARACIDTNCAEIDSVTVTVADRAPRVQWQIVRQGEPLSDDRWQDATGVLEYAFQFDTGDYAQSADWFEIHVRLLEGDVVSVTSFVNARFKGN